MPLNNKRSDTPGNRVNLLPGEIGYNRADDKLLIRGDMRKVEIDLDRWRRRAPPNTGVLGAPLSPDGVGVKWNADLAPTSAVNGKIAVDLPPAAYGVPGWIAANSGGAAVLGANAVYTEPFYVASDDITLSQIGCSIISGAADIIRLGIAAEDGTVLLDVLIETPVIGINAQAVGLVLPRGHYHALFYTFAPANVAVISGYRYNQSFEGLSDGTRLFYSRSTGVADMSNGLYFNGLIRSDQTSALPGEDKSVMLRWTP